MTFVHLHTHSDHSLLDGFARVPDLIAAAKADGQPALALTDHGTMAGLFSFHKQCRAAGVKPILGMEAYHHPTHGAAAGGKMWNHLLLLARDREGLGRMMEINARAWDDPVRRKPIVTDDILRTVGTEGIISTTGCLSAAVPATLLSEGYDAACRVVESQLSLFDPSRYFVEIQDHGIDDQLAIIDDLFRLAEQFGLVPVATNDSHYLSVDEADAHDGYLAMGTGTTIDDPRAFHFNGHGHHFRTEEEMREVFPPERFGVDVVSATARVADLVSDYDLTDGTYKIPAYSHDPNHSDAEEIRVRTEKFLTDRFGEDVPQAYRDRANHEMSVIDSMGFSGYTLIVADDIIGWPREHGITIGPGRGCLKGDTPVRTEDGFKPISEITAGERVLTHTGQWHEVTDTFRYDVSEPLVRVHSCFDHGGGVTMTSDHKVLVVRGGADGPMTWVEAGRLDENDYVAVPRPSSPGVAPHTVDLASSCDPETCRTSESEIVETRRFTRDFPGSVDDLVPRHDVPRGFFRRVLSRKASNDMVEQVSRVVEQEGFDSLEAWMEYFQHTRRLTNTMARRVSIDEDFLFVLGAWIASGKGGAGSPVAQWRVGVNHDDGSLPKYLRHVVGPGVPVTTRECHGVVSYRLHSPTWCRFLSGMVPGHGRLDKDADVPSWVDDLDVAGKEALLHGLWWGNPHNHIIVASEALSDSVRRLLWSVGSPAGLSQQFGPGGVPLWCVHTSINSQASSWFATDSHILYRVKGVVAEVGVDEVFDIQVEGDHSFCTSSYVVHNSAAGSLVNWAVGITDIDPIAHDCYFERYLNPSRHSMPDIDVDMESGSQARIVDHLREKFGADHVAHIATMQVQKPKSALRNALRVCGVPHRQADKLASVWRDVDDSPCSLARALDPHAPNRDEVCSDGWRANHELRDMVRDWEDDPRIDVEALHRGLEMAGRFEGKIRTVGEHAAGVLITPEPVTHYAPIRIDDDGFMVVEWDLHDCEEAGLVKFDLLRLAALNVISRTVEMIAESTGEHVDVRSIPRDDHQVFAMLQQGHTDGLFQLSGEGITKVTTSIRPESLDDIGVINALYRPGPMGMGVHESFADAKSGRKPLDLPDPAMREVLPDTFCAPIYQESIQKLAMVYAGYDAAQADLFRRAIGKKDMDTLMAQKEPFISGCLDNGHSATVAHDLWDMMLPYASYAFNRCVSGDCVMTKAATRDSSDRTMSVEMAHRLFHAEDFLLEPHSGRSRGFDGPCVICHRHTRTYVRGCCASCRRRIRNLTDRGFLSILALDIDGLIRPARCVDVHDSGPQTLWRITLADGSAITSTADHRHMGPDGWRRTGTLEVGDRLLVMGEPAIGEPRRARHVSSWERHQAYATGRCASCGRVIPDAPSPRDFLITRDGEDRAVVLCASCLRSRAARDSWFTRGRKTRSEEIVAIECVGVHPTFDVEMDSDNHSWVCNGVVTHNSHAIAYGLVAYWEAWLKLHYTPFFAAATLDAGSHSSLASIREQMEFARSQGVQVVGPDITKSHGPTSVEGQTIYLGLSGLPGIGEATVQRILTNRARHDGPIRHILDAVHSLGLSKTMVQGLAQVGAFEHLPGSSSRKAVRDNAERIVTAARNWQPLDGGGLFGDVDDDFSDEAQVRSLGLDGEDFSPVQRAVAEREVLGFVVGHHPVSDVRPLLGAAQITGFLPENATIVGDEDVHDGDEDLALVGMVSAVKQTTTNSGRPMTRVQVESDRGASLTCVGFGVSPTPQTGAFICVRGSVHEFKDSLDFSADSWEVFTLPQLEAGSRATWHKGDTATVTDLSRMRGRSAVTRRSGVFRRQRSPRGNQRTVVAMTSHPRPARVSAPATFHYVIDGERIDVLARFLEAVKHDRGDATVRLTVDSTTMTFTDVGWNPDLFTEFVKEAK